MWKTPVNTISFPTIFGPGYLQWTFFFSYAVYVRAYSKVANSIAIISSAATQKLV